MLLQKLKNLPGKPLVICTIILLILAVFSLSRYFFFSPSPPTALPDDIMGLKVKNVRWGPVYEYENPLICFSGDCPRKTWTWCVDLQGGDGHSYTVLNAFKDMYPVEIETLEDTFRILNDPAYSEQDKKSVSTMLPKRDASTSTAQDYIFRLAEAEYQTAEKKRAVEAELIRQFSVGMPVVITYIQSSGSAGRWIYRSSSSKKECRTRALPPPQKKTPRLVEEMARPSDSDPLAGMDKSNPKTRYLMEGLTAASTFRTMLAEGYLMTGGWPGNNAAAGLPPPEHYKTAGVESITASADGSNGIITICYSAKVDPVKNTLLLTAKGTDGAFEWRCVSPPGNGVEEALLPLACRSK